MIFFILTVLISMSISFSCSLLEACLLSVSNTDIAKLSEQKPKIAEIWKRFKNNIQGPIAVILIINTFAHTIGAALSGSQFNELFGHEWVWIYSIVFSIFMIQWMEILPKTYGIKYNKFFATKIAVPLSILMKIFNPILLTIQWMNRPFEGKKKLNAEVDAINDINVLAHFASLQNIISKEQAKMISRSITLSRKKVEDIMVSTEEMKALLTRMSLTEALLEAHISHHTRFPLIEGNNVIGYVNFKDIVSALQLNPKDPSLKGICRPILEVSNDEDLTSLLNKLTKNYQHIALVKNAGGIAVGLVTMEDVVESIVGDINDEYDVLPNFCYQIAKNRFVIGGGITLAALRQKIGKNLPDLDIPLNEWLSEKLKRVPKPEDKIQANEFTFIIRKVSRSKIHEVTVDKR